MSDQSLAQQLAAMAEQIAALTSAASAASEPDAVTAKVLADGPGKRTARGKATAAKAAGVERNMTSRLVTLDGKSKDHTIGTALPEGVVFLVMPESASKSSNVIFRNGSRCKPYVDGSPVRGSWPRDVVIAAATISSAIVAAHEVVDERALLGSFKPAAVAS